MKKSDQYLKVVGWSDEDKCYVGRCPELMFGGVHGKNQQNVFADLCKAIDAWINVKEGKSLNAYCVEALEKELNR